MLKTEEAQRQISEVEPEDDADVNETTAKLLSVSSSSSSTVCLPGNKGHNYK